MLLEYLANVSINTIVGERLTDKFSKKTQDRINHFIVTLLVRPLNKVCDLTQEIGPV